MKYTIQISDAEITTVQTALDQRNALLKSEGLTQIASVSDFLQAVVEEHFGFASQVAATARQDAINAIVEAVRNAPTEQLADVAAAVEGVVKPIAVEPTPITPVEEPLEP